MILDRTFGRFVACKTILSSFSFFFFFVTYTEPWVYVTLKARKVRRAFSVISKVCFANTYVARCCGKSKDYETLVIQE